MTTPDNAHQPDRSSRPLEGTGDADLVLRSRSGDAEAFGELWQRHYRSGIVVARATTSVLDADDLVQEAYARIYQAIQAGAGPTGSFRAYLFTSIRNTAASWGRARREDPIDEFDAIPDPQTTEAGVGEALDHSLTATAFRSLPTRWQEVLWYTEIERMKPAAVGALLGMSAGATSQLAFRAREGLREAWIQAHLHAAGSEPDCAWTIERLGAYSRGNLSGRDRAKLDAHLEDCQRCVIVAAEAKDVSHRLALVLVPLVLGVSGASAYLAALQHGTATSIPLAAMPSSVMDGAVYLGAAPGIDATAHAASGAGGQSVGAGGAASGAGGAASSGGIISGIGALVGVGSAALVVAGAVVAAAVVPGLLLAPSATSLPIAGELGGPGIVAEVAPDANAEERPLVIVPNASTPRTRSGQDPHTDPRAESPLADAPTSTTPPEQTTPPVDPDPTDPTDPGVTDPGVTDPGETEPGETDPSEPGTTDPTDPTDPGTTDPGTTEPGTPTDPTDPGTTDPTDPGTTDPTDPGTTDPGTTDPGTTDPGTTEPTEPGIPAGAVPTVGAPTITCASFPTLLHWADYAFPLSGIPGAQVELLLGGVVDSTAILDGTGAGVALLPITARDLLKNPSVQFRYVMTSSEVATTPAAKLRSVADPFHCVFGGEPAAAMDDNAPADAADPAPSAPAAPTDEVPSVPAARVESVSDGTLPDESSGAEGAADDPNVGEPAVEEPATGEPASTETPVAEQSVVNALADDPALDGAAVIPAG
ncbi:sigma-70 family RNA polymerase sigma factor [Microbacterium keratanolyticum]